jgi:hypothetical protein
MANDYDRISDWERRTGSTFARFRRQEGFWENMGNADVSF